MKDPLSHSKDGKILPAADAAGHALRTDADCCGCEEKEPPIPSEPQTWPDEGYLPGSPCLLSNPAPLPVYFRVTPGTRYFACTTEYIEFGDYTGCYYVTNTASLVNINPAECGTTFICVDLPMVKRTCCDCNAGGVGAGNCDRDCETSDLAESLEQAFDLTCGTLSGLAPCIKDAQPTPCCCGKCENRQKSGSGYYKADSTAIGGCVHEEWFDIVDGPIGTAFNSTIGRVCPVYQYRVRVKDSGPACSGPSDSGYNTFTAPFCGCGPGSPFAFYPFPTADAVPADCAGVDAALFINCDTIAVRSKFTNALGEVLEYQYTGSVNRARGDCDKGCTGEPRCTPTGGGLLRPADFLTRTDM